MKGKDNIPQNKTKFHLTIKSLEYAFSSGGTIQKCEGNAVNSRFVPQTEATSISS